MKKVIISFAVLCLMFYSGLGQVPQQFNYQAAIRNTDGTIVANDDVDVKISLLKSSANGDVVYQESHIVETNEQGIISLPVGAGTVEAGVFSETPWSESIFIKVDVKIGDASDYSTMGVSQILSVPYAIQAGNAIQGDAAKGNTVTHDGDMWAATNRITINENTVEIVADKDHNPDEPIFAVRNSAGDIVFEVYEGGARVYIDENNQKIRRGGFAVGGLSDQTKQDEVNFLSIMPDEVQFNILQSEQKIRRGGFAVGGLSDQTKGLVPTHNFFTLLPDSVRFTIKDNPEKIRRGGFAVGGLSDQTKGQMDYIYIDGEHTSVLNTLSAMGNVTIQGDMVYGGTVGTAPIEDPEGNTYQTISIGNQVWMRENLKVEQGLIEGDDYVAYNEDPVNVDTYGYLYAQTALLEGLCPSGWRLPTVADWEELFTFVGGVDWETTSNEHVLVSLMEVSDLWPTQDVSPTNITGFSARPGGDGEYSLASNGWSFNNNLGDFAGFWSIGQVGGQGGSFSKVQIDGQVGILNLIDIDNNPVLSIRCIKERVGLD